MTNLGFTTSGSSAALLHLLPLFCVSCNNVMSSLIKVVVVVVWVIAFVVDYALTTQRSCVQFSIKVYRQLNWMVGQGSSVSGVNSLVTQPHPLDQLD